MNVGLRRVGIALVVLVLVLVGQLTYLQVIDADNLKNDPKNIRSALRDINRPRGDIVTADGEIVARSRRIDDTTEFDYQREYPQGGLFSQVVGYQSFVFGNTGIEKTYNDALVGRDAELQIENLPDVFSDQDATGTVVLEMTAAAQRAAADALGDQRGSIVVLDVQSGGIVAMYSNPTYDPNPLTGHDSTAVEQYNRQLRDDPNKPDLARAYRERYPPGSTFKVVTTSVGLENGLVTADTRFPTLRELTLPQTTNTLRNFGSQSCGGSLVVSFYNSCNTTFGQIGLDLGDAFVPGMERFGINDVPPLDLDPGAVSSIGPPAGSFQQNQPLFAFAGIGQGDVAVTPLEMALVAAGIANNGVIKEPHVAKEIRDAEGNVVRRIDPNGKDWKTATDPGTAQAVNAMMQEVVKQGTGTAAQLPNVTVAGKTGTAEHGSGNPHAWFIGFAPAEAPRYAVAVIVEEGGNSGSEATGGRVAAPIAARMLQEVLK